MLAARTVSLALLLPLLLVAPVHAEHAEPARHDTRIGLGLGAVVFASRGIVELVIPLHLRRSYGRFALELGRDSFVSSDTTYAALLGIYRVGALLHTDHGPWRPYAYGRFAFLLAGAHDDRPHVWNVGAHVGAGGGLERSFGRLGAFVEVGLFADVGGAFIVPSFAAGAFVSL